MSAPRAEWKPLREDGRAILTKSVEGLLLPVSLFGLAFILLNVLRLDALLTLVAAGFVWRYSRAKGSRFRSRVPSDALGAHTSWPLVEGSYPVQVTYLRYMERVGHDEAIAAFADGWLFVDGLRARFGLRLEDTVVTFPADGSVALDFPHGERVELEAFDTMVAHGVSGRAFRERFDRALRTWSSAEESPIEARRPSPLPRLRSRWPLVQTTSWFCSGVLLMILAFPTPERANATGWRIALSLSLVGLGIGMTFVGFAKVLCFLRYVQGLPRSLRQGLFRAPAE